MDKLTLTDIPLITRIGIHPWEQQCPQTLHLDIVLQTDAKAIAKQDTLHLAVDYDRVIAHVLQFAQTHHFQLIETFAEHLAQELLTHFKTPWVHLTLHKPGALTKAKNVSISIERHA